MINGYAVSAVVTALRLVVLHGPNGQRVEINPEQVISIREPRGQDKGHFHQGVKCLIFTSDAKMTGVLEDCETVEHKLAATLGRSQPHAYKLSGAK